MTHSATCLLHVLLAATAIGAADEPPWARHVESGMAALIEGQVGKAERCFERCLPFASRGLTYTDGLFREFTTLAIEYGQRGWYRQAKVWARRAIEGFDTLGGPMSPHLVTPLLALGSIELAERRYDESAASLMRAFRIGWTYGRMPDGGVKPVVERLAAALEIEGRVEMVERLRRAFAGNEATPPVFTAATEREGGVTATPRWNDYCEARSDLEAVEGAVTFLARWFEHHDDAQLLDRSAKIVAKVQSEARRRWDELVPHVERYGRARFEFELLRKQNEVSSTVIGAEDRWLRSVSDRLVRAERHFEAIMRARGL